MSNPYKARITGAAKSGGSAPLTDTTTPKVIKPYTEDELDEIKTKSVLLATPEQWTQILPGSKILVLYKKADPQGRMTKTGIVSCNPKENDDKTQSIQCSFDLYTDGKKVTRYYQFRYDEIKEVYLRMNADLINTGRLLLDIIEELKARVEKLELAASGHHRR